jgi:hypothetical protein
MCYVLSAIQIIVMEFRFRQFKIIGPIRIVTASNSGTATSLRSLAGPVRRQGWNNVLGT